MSVRSIVGIRTLVFIILAIGVFAGTAWAADDAMDRARLEKMLSDGDTGMIAQVFKRHPGRTLPFIDHYLEGGLAMIEKGEDAEKALKSFHTGIEFAAVADQAFGGTTFSEYANSFASFSPGEQKKFREGQRAFKDGVKETDPIKARQRLEDSQTLARSLGDTWGQAMAWSALADLGQRTGDRDQAFRAAVQAIDLNRRLQLREDLVQALMAAAKSAPTPESQPGVTKPASMQAAGGYLQQAWTLVKDDSEIDAELRETVFKEYVAVLEAAGFKDRAENVRREHRAPQ